MAVESFPVLVVLRLWKRETQLNVHYLFHLKKKPFIQANWKVKESWKWHFLYFKSNNTGQSIIPSLIPTNNPLFQTRPSVSQSTQYLTWTSQIRIWIIFSPSLVIKQLFSTIIHTDRYFRNYPGYIHPRHHVPGLLEEACRHPQLAQDQLNHDHCQEVSSWTNRPGLPLWPHSPCPKNCSPCSKPPCSKCPAPPTSTPCI